MPAYLIAKIRVHDQDSYAHYAARSPAIVARYGGRILARGSTTEILEGDASAVRVVIVEFASMDAAKRLYHSPEYQELRKIRAAVADAHIVVVEGVE
jgi:uncharacterized protein (DUF1330 family)